MARTLRVVQFNFSDIQITPLNDGGYSVVVYYTVEFDDGTGQSREITATVNSGRQKQSLDELKTMVEDAIKSREGL